MKRNALTEKLRHHISGAIERGEAEAVAGLPAIVECGDPLARSHASATLILESKMARVCGADRELVLSHHSPGYVIAGSCMRWDDERFKVLWHDGRSFQGRSFKAQSEAQTYYDGFRPSVALDPA